jgi:cobalt-zinc-cadmium efflux system membrane fusion protein
VNLKVTIFAIVILGAWGLGPQTINGQPAIVPGKGSAEPAAQRFSAGIQVMIDPEKLRAAGLTPTHVSAVIESFYKEHRRFTLAELESAPVATIDGKKYLVKDVATITVGFENKAAAGSGAPASLFFDGDGRPGLRLTAAAALALGIELDIAQLVTKAQPLPAQKGTINYDSDRLFVVRPRFDAEVVELGQVDEAPDPAKPNAKAQKRMLRYGDRVKQGELLAVLFSAELGKAKGALVAALLDLRLSKDAVDRLRKLYEEGGISAKVLQQAERQEQVDRTAALAAERSLRLQKLSDKEIQELRDEAKVLGEAMKDKKLVRDAKAEAEKWARIEIRAPTLTSNPKQELIIVERNAIINEVVRPFEGPPIFKLANTDRLQVWVALPHEYVPVVQRMVSSAEKGAPTARVEFPGDARQKPMHLRFRIGPLGDVEGAARMLIADLDNPKGDTYLVGSFVNVAILVPPRPDVVAIPTAALHEAGGQTLLFVQPDPAKNEYLLRRVAVAERFKDVAWVHSKLAADQIEQNTQDAKQGKRPVEPLLPGERVVVRGVVELAAALEAQSAKEGKRSTR